MRKRFLYIFLVMQTLTFYGLFSTKSFDDYIDKFLTELNFKIDSLTLDIYFDKKNVNDIFDPFKCVELDRLCELQRRALYYINNIDSEAVKLELSCRPLSIEWLLPLLSNSKGIEKIRKILSLRCFEEKKRLAKDLLEKFINCEDFVSSKYTNDLWDLFLMIGV